MKLFPEEPSFIPGEVGFDSKDEKGRSYDLLGRRPVGQRLTDLLDRVEQPLVIALDGGWGSGKSHFLKLWTGAHSLELGGKAKIIYFDAFEHDYLDDPLISLVARLTTNEAEASWGKKTIKAIQRAALPLAKLSLRLGAAAATAGVTEIAGPVADAVAIKTGEATQASIDAFWKRETDRIAAMQRFRDALTVLIAPTNDGESPQKIVIIIDELDRCRPDYALTLLEIVKHFFAVPNVHFVLGTNVGALENSVRARYGADMNATEYLMKFIQLRMRFPERREHPGNNDWELYFDAHVKHCGIHNSITLCLKNVLVVYSQGRLLSLRDIERITSRLALFPKSVLNLSIDHQRLVFSVLVMQVLAPDAYMQFRSGRLEISRILDLFPEASRERRVADEADRLRRLWQEALVFNPDYRASDATALIFKFSNEEQRRYHFEPMWAELFDTFQIAGPSI
jgi:KAP family P-loop domain